jgi:two-component system, NarL family, sensor histidine kinase BarA
LDPVEPRLHAPLSDLVDSQTFGEVCRAFHALFDVAIRVFDEKNNLLVETESRHPLCRYLSRFEGGRSGCQRTRLSVKAGSADSREIEHIDCFCGLRYSIAPILDDRQVAGKLVLGPYLPAGVERVPRGLLETSPDVDQRRIADLLGQSRRVGDGSLRRIARAIASVLDVVLFAARKAHVTSEIHLASVRESYREMADKNRQLEEMNEQMREFERQKSNFLAMVSHELRTPLTSIIGYSDMLVEGIAGELAEEQRQFVETIKTKGDELLKLISSILDFSRIGTGHLTLQLVETDVGKLVSEAVDEKLAAAERRGVTLSCDVAKDLPRLEVDPEKLLTSLAHLIDNAIKFSAPGGVVKVTAGLKSAEAGEGPEDGFGFVLMATTDMLDISVRDYGDGIADGDLGRIFSPFLQLDGSSTREHGGAGLGLAIVKHYVEAHGGQVQVESTQGQGSCFSVQLPVTSEE